MAAMLAMLVEKNERLVIEDLSKRQRVISSIHDSGHLGVNRTLDMVSAKYYWPGLTCDVKQYVSHVSLPLNKARVYHEFITNSNILLRRSQLFASICLDIMHCANGHACMLTSLQVKPPHIVITMHLHYDVHSYSLLNSLVPVS